MIRSPRNSARTCTAILAALLLGCSPCTRNHDASIDADVPLVRLEAPSAPVPASAPVNLGPRQTILSAAEVTIPLLNVGGLPMVEWIDSAGSTRRFLIDTGAN